MAVILSKHGEKGDPGPAGSQGPAGQNAVASSDALRGAADRFYKVVAGVMTYDGSQWLLNNDAFARGHNVDQVTTTNKKIVVEHSSIDALRVVAASAEVGENLTSVGISTLVNPSQETTEILLKQNRILSDALTSTGTSWIREKGGASPFTVAGLDGTSVNWDTLIAAESPIAAWSFDETSGATIQDVTVNNNDGAVVSTGTTYGITAGGLANDPGDKAMKTSGAGTGEFTFPWGTLVGSGDYTVIWYGKFTPGANTVLFKDATNTTTGGHFISKAGTKLMWRLGITAQSWVTAYDWANLEDGEYHLVVLVNAGTTAQLYIDDQFVENRTGLAHSAVNGLMHIGRTGHGGSAVVSEPMEMSELAILNTATMTYADVLALNYAATTDGLLHIAHADIGETLASGIRLSALGPLRPLLIPASVTPTGFDIKFLDVDGNQVSVGDTDMAVAIERKVVNRAVDPTNVVVDVKVVKDDSWTTVVGASNPALWARLGESSGTNFNDEIGTNDGTSQATVTLGVASAIDGDANTAVTFDGAQGKIAFANPALTGPLSFHLAFKCTGAGSVGAGSLGTLLGWSTGGTTRRIQTSTSDGSLRIEAGGAILTTNTGIAPLNAWNYFLYTWDGVTQKAYCNGLLVAEGVSGNISINNPIWLGSYLGTSTNHSFKGSMDEFLLWNRALTINEVQQLYVIATDDVLTVDRSMSARIFFEGTYETAAPLPEPPPDQPPPDPTPLPAGDIGGEASSYISLAPYRDLLSFGPGDPWVHRALPTDQSSRNAILLNGIGASPNATSLNWKNDLCAMFGVDSTTGAPTVGTQGNPSVYLRVQGEQIYVVPSNQPRRTFTDIDQSVSGWAASINAANAALGGVPAPADGFPHFTGDRYGFVFQPDDGSGNQSWWTIYHWAPSQSDRATTTIALTGSPSSGGFFSEFDYRDHLNQNLQTFFLQSPVPHDCTSAQLQSLINAAKTTTGTVFAPNNSRAFTTPALVSGGPLNVAPLVIQWTIAAPLWPVAWRWSDNFMNSGVPQFTYKNADAHSSSTLAAVTSASIVSNATHHLPYMNVPDGGGTNVPATAAATHIDWMPLIADWAEVKLAYDAGLAAGDGTVAGANWDAPGTDLGHVLAMSIGNCGLGHVYPATGGDGTLSNPTFAKIVEGALITFPTTADATKTLAFSSAVFMPIFNTIKRYGIIPIDKTGGGAEIIFRNWTWPGVSRPFPGPPAMQFGSQIYPTYMKNLPWHQAQIIDPAAVLAGW